jgi:hypothetical protein
MPSRKLLTEQLREAWRLTMTVEYSAQLVNSERGLQYFFCRHLQQLFDCASVHRRLFIEPCLSNANGKVRSPDLVICHTQSIIGIVEFKYKPCGRANATKDLATLAWFLSHPKDLELSNRRYRGSGERAVKCYSLASDALLCWAGVYARSSVRQEATSTGVRTNGRFLGLHAATTSGSPPRLAFE